MTRDASWNYTNAIKYFIKSERFIDNESLSLYPECHGTDGGWV